MNLIDILKRILNTKNEIKSIINTDSPVLNNDFSRYSTAVYNFLASAYNEGYINGYDTYYYSITQVHSYPSAPLSLKDPTLVNTSNYDPYTVEGLTDIMRSVLGFREDTRDEIQVFSETVTDSFVTYPEYLNVLKNTLYSTGEDDGVSAAAEVIVDSEDVESPTAAYSSDNIFSLSTEQAGAALWFKVGIGGVESRYSEPIYIKEKSTFKIYYWAKVGASISNNDKDYLYITCSSDQSVGPDLPGGVEILSPVIDVIDNKIFISDPNGDKGVLEYCINYDDTTTEDNTWYIYTGPITATSDMENVAARVRVDSVYTEPTVVDVPEVIVPPSPDDPTITLLPPEAVDYTFDTSSMKVTLSCPTENALIQYNINGESGGSMTTYTEPFVVSSDSIIVLYTTSTLDYGVYGSMVHDKWYRFSTYGLVINPPQISTLDDGKVYIVSSNGNTRIEYSITQNQDDVISEWTVYNGQRVSIDVPNNNWVHAKVVHTNTGVESSVVDYFYDWYTQTFSLDVPTYRFEDNYLFLSSPYTIYYTVDGSDPMSKEHIWGNTLNTYGLAITDPTTVKCISYNYDSENDKAYYSETLILNLTPVEIDSNYINEYFTVLGASTINMPGYNWCWSYDKNTWTPFSGTVTGLDPSRNVYIYASSAPHYGINTISFIGDNITVSGNVVSLFYALDFRDNVDTFTEDLDYLFEGCTNLIDASNLYIPSGTSGFKRMFKDCTGLISAPKQLFMNDVPTSGFESTFENCTSLTSTPRFSISTVGERGMMNTFKGCTSLEVCNIGFNLSSVGERGFESCFEGCTSLVNVGFNVLPSATISNNSFNKCFCNTGQLNTNTIYLDASTLSTGCYTRMFMGSKITRFVNILPALNVPENGYYSMFESCTRLVTPPDVRAVSCGSYSLNRMFYGCSSLTSSPILYAHTVISHAYDELFRNCSNLSRIECHLLTDPLGQGGTEINPNYPYTWNWVDGVSGTGTFIQDDDAVWYRFGSSAIPTGWNVVGKNLEVGTISGISINRDKVTISTLSSDSIQYQLNGTNGVWSNYTGPITMTSNSVTVYARCINTRGVTGEVYSKEVTVTDLPEITITLANATVTLTNPSNFYSSISYCWGEYGEGNISGNWNVYSEPIYMGYGKQGRLYVMGTTEGGLRSEIWYKDLQSIEETVIPSVEIFWTSDPESEYVNKIWFSTNPLYSVYYRIEYPGSYVLWDGEYVDVPSGFSGYIRAYYKDETTGRISASITDKYIYYVEPVIRPASPTITFNSTTNTVTITSDIPYAIIKYGFDSTHKDNFVGYNGPFTITESHTVRAYVRIDGSDSYLSSLYCEYTETQEMEPLTFTFAYPGTLNIVNDYGSGSWTDENRLQYRYNGGNWKSIKYVPITFYDVSTIQFRGNLLSSYSGYRFDTQTPFSLSGNIMSIYDKDNYNTATEIRSIGFVGLFRNCLGLQNAHELVLPATTFVGGSSGVYEEMFYGCSNLVSAPSLPATTLASNCYKSMFAKCSSLTTAPSLPATTLASNCYYRMFYLCSSLTTAPSLPATTLASGCYSSMFESCTSLTTAPSLPATILASGCYNNMFSSCSSLLTAPTLSATTLVNNCYKGMFQYCSNLNFIKCFATNPDSSLNNSSLYQWMKGAGQTSSVQCIFVKKSGVSWPTGESGIPTGWTVMEE